MVLPLLVVTGDGTWHARWQLEFDMNHDGAITISDVWAWLMWLYFAPGDFIILGTVKYFPALAKFFEIDASMTYGRLSFCLSTILYLLWILGLAFEDRHRFWRERRGG